MFQPVVIIPVLLATCLMAGEGAPAPTIDETMLWTRINRHRNDPRSFDFEIVSMARQGLIPVGTHKDPSFVARDWCKARSDTAMNPMPMLCLNDRLNAAARELLKQKPPKEQRIDPAPLMQAVGYAPADAGWAMLGLDAPSLEAAYGRAMGRIYLLEVKKTKTIYRHDGYRLTAPEWREVGIAVSCTKGMYSAAIILGKGSAKRYLAGTVYADADHDAVLDPGEGKAGVHVRVGNVTTVTGPGGAWWLAGEEDGPCAIAFTSEGASAKRSVETGTALIDWRLPNATDTKTADKLLADLKAVDSAKDPAKARKALVALLLGTRMAILDDARQQRIDEAVRSVRLEYEDMLRRLLGQMGEDPTVFKAKLSDVMKSWNGALPSTWGKSIEAIYVIGQKVTAARAAPPAQQAGLATPLTEPLAKAIEKADDPLILKQLVLWRNFLTELGGEGD